MFRRIEIISHGHTPEEIEEHRQNVIRWKLNEFDSLTIDQCVQVFINEGRTKSGIWCGAQTDVAFDALDEVWGKHITGDTKRKLRGKRRAKFFFTEKGWKVCGGKTAEFLRRNGVEIRVITIKEHSVDVAWEAANGNEVAVRPRKHRNDQG